MEKIEKLMFLAIFGLLLAMFLTSQPYDFDATAHVRTLIWCRMTKKFRSNRMDTF